jgi:hypothetical protein
MIRSRRQMTHLILVALVGTGLASCMPTVPFADPNLLSFLRMGETTRQDVLLMLGQPSASFEQERILTYRLGQDSTQGYYLVTPSQFSQWQNVHYSLVLVFDANGRLEKQRLVPVR